MMRLSRHLTRTTAATALVLALAGCESTDQTPPKGATISVSASPATIPLTSAPECLSLLTVTQCGTAQIIATVSNELGVPLPDQDVRFSSSAGFLFTGTVTSPVPALNVPIPTDGFGNATINVVTAATTTVTARSGAATAGMATLNTVQGNLSQILLNLDTTTTCPTPTSTITSCSQQVCLIAEAQETDGDPVPGVVILFELQNNTVGMNTFNGVFTPSQATTNAMGQATSVFVPDSTCPAECAPSSTKSCDGEIIARTQGGVTSGALDLTINIP